MAGKVPGDHGSSASLRLGRKRWRGMQSTFAWNGAWMGGLHWFSLGNAILVPFILDGIFSARPAPALADPMSFHAH